MFFFSFYYVFSVLVDNDSDCGCGECIDAWRERRGNDETGHNTHHSAAGALVANICVSLSAFVFIGGVAVVMNVKVQGAEGEAGAGQRQHTCRRRCTNMCVCGRRAKSN